MTAGYRRLAAVIAVAAGVSLAVPASAGARVELMPTATPAATLGSASTYHSVDAFTAYASTGRLTPGHEVDVSLAGKHGLPAIGGFDGVALTVTVAKATKTTAASVSAGGGSSHSLVVSATAKHAATGFTMAAVDADGAVQLRLSGGHAQVRLVVEGYQTAGTGGETFHPLTAAPVLRAHRLGGRATTSISLAGAAASGLPPNGHIAAVALAVTAAHATSSTTITAYARGHSASAGQPVVSASKAVTASGVGIVAVGRHHGVTLRNSHGKVTLSAEVEGYWTTDPTGASFSSVTPRTVFAGTTAAKGWQRVTLAGRFGLPTAAESSAAVLSITVARPSGAAYLAVSPSGHGKPSSGPISVDAHSRRTTVVVARLGGGKVGVYASRRMSVTVTVIGWYGPTATGTDVNASAGGCASPLPTGTSFAVIRTTNGQPFSSADPTCFGTDMTEAAALPAAPEFYMNLADPGEASTLHWHQGGPRACHVTHDFDTGCAYDYGYEAAKAAVGFAASYGMAPGSRWWIDVEMGNSWGSHNLEVPGHIAANVADIRGALHYLKSHGLPAGVYTETAWWITITGSPTGFSHVPVWGGGADSRANAQANCKAVSITGGPALLAQWFTDVLHDHDVAC